MGDFNISVNKLLSIEGGYSDDPFDSGGETIYGITKRDHPELWINGHPPSKEQCIAIYRNDYWRFDNVYSQSVCDKLLDMSANMGLTSAILILQRCLNSIGHKLKMDGVYGSKTEAAVNTTINEELLQLLRSESAVHYALVLLANPKNKRFIRGWMKRAVS